MKTIELKSTRGGRVSIFIDKICAVMDKNGVTSIFVIGDSAPFQTYAPYHEVMEKIEEAYSDNL